MNALRSSAVMLLLGACATTPPHLQDDPWQAFQDRCLSPIIEQRVFVTNGLQAIPPETIFPETVTGSTLSSNARAFRPASGTWLMLTETNESERLCVVVTQSTDSQARRSAQAWATQAVQSDGFAFDHHSGAEVTRTMDGTRVSVRFGSAVGWPTAFTAFSSQP